MLKGTLDMMTQIYSIQNVEEARMCLDAGADSIGVAVSTGMHLPSEVSVDACKDIFDAIGDKALKVLIVVTRSEEPIFEPMDQLRPDIIHICGNEYFATPEFVAKVKARHPRMRVLQAIAVDGEEAISRARHFAAFCDMLILDSVDPKIAGIGAAGITHDWALSARIVEAVDCPVILAGGLGPDNVAAAIHQVRPWGVDSFTKTSDKLPDGTTRKNPDKIRAFVRNARQAFEELRT